MLVLGGTEIGFLIIDLRSTGMFARIFCRFAIADHYLHGYFNVSRKYH